jgi:hypothetical protein
MPLAAYPFVGRSIDAVTLSRSAWEAKKHRDESVFDMFGLLADHPRRYRDGGVPG